jgi:hypothetical protein
VGKLREYVNKKFGVKTRIVINDIVNSVGTSVTKILANKPDRLAFLIVNLGTGALYILSDPTVSATKGILIEPNGGNYVALPDEDFDLVGYEWFAVASAATNILTLEIIAE